MRATEWWEYKLVPILSLFYATAFVLRVPLISLWSAALMLLLAIVPGAAYVSVINDLTDRDDDRAAGKSNRIAGLSGPLVAALLVATIAPGLLFSWLWRRDVPLLTFYLAAWLAFSLYSLRPFRLKARGILGVLCDASGAHLFPTLIAVTLAFRAVHRPIDRLWILSAGAWAFAYGLRGILWHQLSDAKNDRLAGVRTFADRHPRGAAFLGTFVVFPFEVAALASLLWQLRSIALAAWVALYVCVALLRVYRWRTNPVIVVPKPRFFIVLHEYYDVFFPLGILVASIAREWRDVLALAIHLVLFPGRILQTGRDLGRVPRELYGMVILRWRTRQER